MEMFSILTRDLCTWKSFFKMAEDNEKYAILWLEKNQPIVNIYIDFYDF